ncbi:MAG: ATP-binding cassette domain-containing protein [Streptosporangiales bacterium]|nr:ATP-binding cassette domain-containing protein [Streptosporangiales bacterium]
MTETTEALLRVRDLGVVYHTGGGRTLPALQDVSFDVEPGAIVGIVGESGCGKSTLSGALMRLLPANGEISSGEIVLGGRDLRGLDDAQLRDVRGREISMIFQDPLSSLNPSFTIGSQLREIQRAHRRHQRRSGAAMRKHAIDLLDQVGIPEPDRALRRFPHEFSGGMRQRVMIAMALLLEPSILIADEPTSALDVTLEAQVLELLSRLRDEHGTSILFVTHDLGVVAQLCDTVVVMYAGQAVEYADVHTLFERPRHPYTEALLAAMPALERRHETLASIPGRVPDLAALPEGCRFTPRCPYARAACADAPAMSTSDSVLVRCHRYDPDSGYEESAPPAAANGETR